MEVILPNWGKEKRAKMAAENVISNLNWKNLCKFSRDMDSKEQYQMLKEFKKAWVLPQLMAWLGKDNGVKLYKNCDGQYSVQDTLLNLISKANAGGLYFENGTAVDQDTLQGIFTFLSKPDRSQIVVGTATENMRFNACVPIFMSAFKQYRSVPYSAWNWSDRGLVHVLDPAWQELVKYFGRDFSNYSKKELEEIRSKCDQSYHIADAYKVSFNFIKPLSNEMAEFNDYPRLLKLMLLQMWVFKPQHRHTLGIFSTSNFDSYPENLVEI